MGFGGLVPATCCLPVAQGPEGLCSGCVGSRRGLASEAGHLGVCGLRHFLAVTQAAGPALGGGWRVLPPSLLSLHGLTPSSLLLQTTPSPESRPRGSPSPRVMATTSYLPCNLPSDWLLLQPRSWVETVSPGTCVSSTARR